MLSFGYSTTDKLAPQLNEGGFDRSELLPGGDAGGDGAGCGFTGAPPKSGERLGPPPRPGGGAVPRPGGGDVPRPGGGEVPPSPGGGDVPPNPGGKPVPSPAGGFALGEDCGPPNGDEPGNPNGGRPSGPDDDGVAGLSNCGSGAGEPR